MARAVTANPDMAWLADICDRVHAEIGSNRPLPKAEARILSRLENLAQAEERDTIAAVSRKHTQRYTPTVVRLSKSKSKMRAKDRFSLRFLLFTS